MKMTGSSSLRTFVKQAAWLLAGTGRCAGFPVSLLFNNTSRVEQDPDRGPRLAMEHVLKLS
jgi:hypothetical protein